MKTFKRTFLTLAFASIVASGLGCAGPNTERGAVLGGLLGAGAGAIIGNQSGRPLEGAAIGGAIGAVGGAAIGNANDQERGFGRR